MHSIYKLLSIVMVVLLATCSFAQELLETPAIPGNSLPLEQNALIDDTAMPVAGQSEDVAEVDAAVYQQTVAAGIDFLINKGQDREDGSFSKELGSAVTAMCTTALMKHGLPLEHESVAKGLAYLETFVQEDGGVYPLGSSLRNYETSVAVMCFVQANADGRYDVQIQNAVGFLKGLQWDEGEGHGPDSPFYGGAGYGNHERPDLSNTSFFVDALTAAGEDPESKALQNAKMFLSRCQNLQSPDNEQEFTQEIKPDDEGGLIYTPVGPESKATWDEETESDPNGAGNAGAAEGVANQAVAGEGVVEGVVEVPAAGVPAAGVPAAEVQAAGEDIGQAPEEQKDVGGLRSYASMTYAGLKSFLYAGLEQDDIRVKAAKDWISRHYDLSSNPGMGQQGLYYYYHVFAKALDVNGERLIVDGDGVAHNWRADLVAELHAKQLNDGSWTNQADRWYEGDPNLVTSYALLGLSYCSPENDK